ncbi:hypothetical protein KAJ77_04130, partial [bacterium]|nr:hypothetical protein [bacterium]
HNYINIRKKVQREKINASEQEFRIQNPVARRKALALQKRYLIQHDLLRHRLESEDASTSFGRLPPSHEASTVALRAMVDKTVDMQGRQSITKKNFRVHGDGPQKSISITVFDPWGRFSKIKYFTNANI